MEVDKLAMASTAVTATRTTMAIPSMETQIAGMGHILAASLHHSVVPHHSFDSEAGVAAGPFAVVALRRSVAHHLYLFEGGLLHHALLVVVHRTPSDLSVSNLNLRTSGGHAIGAAVAGSVRHHATETARKAPTWGVVHPLKWAAPSGLHIQTHGTS